MHCDLIVGAFASARWRMFLMPAISLASFSNASPRDEIPATTYAPATAHLLISLMPPLSSERRRRALRYAHHGATFVV